MGCCGRLRSELSTPFFGVEETNGKRVDLERSFCYGLHRSWSIILIKFILCGVTVFTYVWGWIDFVYPSFFMAYISYWTLLYACVYTLFSLGIAFVGQPRNFAVKAAWVMYSIAAVHGLMVVVLYWTTEYDPDTTDVNYFTVMSHGGTFAIVLIDGIIINRVPVRLKHYFFNLFFGALFVTWSIIQGLVPIDNPNTEGTDDEALYNILDWSNNPGFAAIVSAAVLFVCFPLFQMLFWGISLIGRRYSMDAGQLDTGASEGSSPGGDVEAPAGRPQMTLAEAF